MKKKILAIGLLAAVVITVFVSCSNHSACDFCSKGKHNDVFGESVTLCGSCRNDLVIF